MNVTYENYRKKVGQAIQKKREERGLSREKLAALIEGVCTQTVLRIESANYTKDVSLFSIQAICKELGLAIKLTLGGHDE